MQRKLIAAFVSALIVFIYHAFSWTVLPLHTDAMRHTPAEGALLRTMQEAGMEEALYSLPGKAPGMGPEEERAMWKANAGKPWAMLSYHPATDMSVPRTMIKAFVHSLLAAFILVMVLAHGRFATFGSRLLVSAAMGLFVVLNSVLEDMNWWQLPWNFASGQLVDHLASWTLCGLWLGWYMRPEPRS